MAQFEDSPHVTTIGSAHPEKVPKQERLCALITAELMIGMVSRAKATDIFQRSDDDSHIHKNLLKAFISEQKYALHNAMESTGEGPAKL